MLVLIRTPMHHSIPHSFHVVSAIGELPLFHGLSDTELASVERGLTQVRMPSHTILMAYAHATTMVYILIKGAVKVQIEQTDGSAVIVTVLGPGHVLGEMSQTDGLNCAATIETLEPSVVLSMSSAHYQHLLRTIPALSANLVRLLTLRLRIANQQILALATLGAEGRVASQIRSLAHEYGYSGHTEGIMIPFRLTQSTLAALTGLSRVRVNQVLQQFQKEQIITLAPRYHVILRDESALAAYTTAIHHPTSPRRRAKPHVVLPTSPPKC